MEKECCNLCPLGHFGRPCSTITTCIQPLLTTEHHKPCHEYCPPIEPITAVRFVQPSNAQQGCSKWTNLMYRPIIQGALKYRGIFKLVPLDPPPSNPVLCRPAPIKPTDTKGMVVYSREPYLHEYI